MCEWLYFDAFRLLANCVNRNDVLSLPSMYLYVCAVFGSLVYLILICLRKRFGAKWTNKQKESNYRLFRIPTLAVREFNSEKTQKVTTNLNYNLYMYNLYILDIKRCTLFSVVYGFEHANSFFVSHYYYYQSSLCAPWHFTDSLMIRIKCISNPFLVTLKLIMKW